MELLPSCLSVGKARRSAWVRVKPFIPSPMSAQAAEGRIYERLFCHHSNHIVKVGPFSYTPLHGKRAEFNFSVRMEMGLLCLDVPYQDSLGRELLICCCKVSMRPVWICASKFNPLKSYVMQNLALVWPFSN